MSIDSNTRDSFYRNLVNAVESNEGWSQECDEAAITYARYAIANGVEVSKVRAEIIECGLSRKGANQVIRQASAESSRGTRRLSRARVRQVRVIYHVLFFVHFGCTLWWIVGGQPDVAFVAALSLWVAFLCIFATVARRVLAYSISGLIAMAVVLTFVPLINLVVLAIIDRRVWESIRMPPRASSRST